MKKAISVFTLIGVILLSRPCISATGSSLFGKGSVSDQATTKSVQTKPATQQTKPQTKQTKPKSATAAKKPVKPGSKSVTTRSKPATTAAKPATVKKVVEAGTVRIATQTWAAANLDVIKFRNGDSIPEAKTNEEWVKAGDSGKPAWCYYNNDPVTGKKYGKLYNWYAVNDPRGLAPAGWSIPTDEDWVALTYSLGGQTVAGTKLKTAAGWADGSNGTNESGFSGLPAGYRVENGKFLNIGSIGTWWSATESKSATAFDHYLVLSGSFSRSSNPKQRGESVRCIRK